MNWGQFKDPLSHVSLAGAVVASWSLTQLQLGFCSRQREFGKAPITVDSSVSMGASPRKLLVQNGRNIDFYLYRRKAPKAPQ